MKYVNILLIGLVLLFPGCTFLDVVPEGNIESIESNFEKRDQTENWFKYCHFWVSPFTTSVISNPAYMGTDEVVAGTYLRESVLLVDNQVGGVPFPIAFGSLDGIFGISSHNVQVSEFGRSQIIVRIFILNDFIATDSR